MRRHSAFFCAVAVPVIVLAAAIDLAAQSGPGRGARQEPPPPGQRLQAKDGDVVVIEGDARVRVVRRRAANVRTIYDGAEHWLVLLIDYVPAIGGKPDGKVDATYGFRQLQGEWPSETRWHGPAVIETYSESDRVAGPLALGIVFPFGLVQIFGANDELYGFSWLYRVSSALAVLTYQGSGRSASGGGVNFDVAEERAIVQLRRTIQMNAGAPGGVSFEAPVRPQTTAPRPAPQSPQASFEPAPIRVGGNVGEPKRVHHVDPVYPPLARQAGLYGVVILEIIIGTDGSVKQAKVLRTPHQMFDQAAIDAALQWRYEPTQLDGRPVAVVMTATVNFSQ